VHGGPGSGNDVFARALISDHRSGEVRAGALSRLVKQAGGGSTARPSYIASKRADPHVIGCWTNHLDARSADAGDGDQRLLTLTPIVRLAIEPALVVVRTDSPIKSMTISSTCEGEARRAGKCRAARSPRARTFVRQLIMKGPACAGRSSRSRPAASASPRCSRPCRHDDRPIERGRRTGCAPASSAPSRRSASGGWRGFPDVPTLQGGGLRHPQVRRCAASGSPGMSPTRDLL